MVDFGDDDLDDVSLELTGVVKDALALGNDLVSDFFGDLGAKGLTAGTEIILDKGLPGDGSDPLGSLEGGLEGLGDQVVDAGLDPVGQHDAARACEYVGIRGLSGGRTFMLERKGCLF